MSGSRISIFKSMVVAFACVGLLGLGACESVSKKLGGGKDGGGSNGELDPDVVREGDFVPVPKSLKDIYFDYDKSEIRGDQRDTLAANAEWIKKNPKVKVQVEGHCDERGTEEYNLALGERRASTIRDYLISYGVEPDRIYSISYGEEMPVDPATSEAAWAKNRRAHFLVNR